MLFALSTFDSLFDFLSILFFFDASTAYVGRAMIFAVGVGALYLAVAAAATVLTAGWEAAAMVLTEGWEAGWTTVGLVTLMLAVRNSGRDTGPAVTATAPRRMVRPPADLIVAALKF